MSTLYISCEMGAAGDMLMAALYELLPDQESFLRTMNELLPDVTVTAEDSVKCGVHGTHMRVTIHGHEEESHHHHEHTAHQEHEEHDHHEHHHHHSMQDIRDILAGLPLQEQVRTEAEAVYWDIAEAEAAVHGTEPGEVHFHEVGALDAVVDVAGVCLAMSMLHPDRVICSPVNVGSGMVKCAHGVLPVPAPATVQLLNGIPYFSGTIRSELCTPTGAALLHHFVDEFGNMPVMAVSQCGCGMGTKDFEVCNCLRIFRAEQPEETETVYELSCELDDMTPEEIGYAREKLEEAGALDVYTIPADMKKNRPGTLLCCLIRNENRTPVLNAVFRHTSTLGIRETACRRYAMHRQIETVAGPLGEVRYKVSNGFGVTRKKAEFEDMAAIARETGLSLREVRERLQK